MRLQKEIADFITSELRKLEPDSEVYLFGSRTDDKAKGGDIDVLWITNKKVPKSRLREIRSAFFQKFGWQKLDIVNFKKDEESAFKNIAMKTAIPLM